MTEDPKRRRDEPIPDQVKPPLAKVIDQVASVRATSRQLLSDLDDILVMLRGMEFDHQIDVEERREQE